MFSAGWKPAGVGQVNDGDVEVWTLFYPIYRYYVKSVLIKRGHYGINRLASFTW